MFRPSLGTETRSFAWLHDALLKGYCADLWSWSQNISDNPHFDEYILFGFCFKVWPAVYLNDCQVFLPLYSPVPVCTVWWGRVVALNLIGDAIFRIILGWKLNWTNKKHYCYTAWMIFKIPCRNAEKHFTASNNKHVGGTERRSSMCSEVSLPRISQKQLGEGPLQGEEAGARWWGMLEWNKVMLIVRLWNMHCPAGGRNQSAAFSELSENIRNPDIRLKISWEFHIVWSHKELRFTKTYSLKFCH